MHEHHHDHQHHHEHGGPRKLPTPEEMEARYQSSEQLWSGQVNPTLVRFASDLEPGTALDVGCGEGADVAWLDEQGWDVLGIDFAPTAVERTRARGLHAEVASFDDFNRGPFDLVSVHFGGVRADAAAVAHLESLVAPGGTLLFVHHDMESEEVAMPEWLAGQLQELKAVTLERIEKESRPGAGAGHTVDVALVARRSL